MNDDTALLQRYAADGAQDAFAELVRRHLGLVYHAALRQTGGDPHRAQEVAQIVFTDLARKAAALAARPHLVAWLHTGTRLAAAQLHRTEARRLAREHTAFTMNADELAAAPEPAADWERLRPLIDDALQTLGERDRAAVLLRFFENRSYAEFAASLSVTEDAARVRVNRALEKLRSALARRSLVSTASALGLALAQPALAATPAGLATSITATALSASAAGLLGASAGAATATFMSTAKITAGIAAALATLSVGVMVYQSTSAPNKLPTNNPAVSTSASTLSAADLDAILHPAQLGPAEAAQALAAYLALPPLADDAAQTEIIERTNRLHALLTVLPADYLAPLFTALIPRTGAPEDRLRHIAFTAWTEHDAPAAARQALALTPGLTINAYDRGLYLREATLAWGHDDFASAYAWTRDLDDADTARELTGQLLCQVATTDPHRAVALARAGGDAFFRAHQAAIFRGWATTEPVPALQTLGYALFESRLTNNDSHYLHQAISHWVERDAPAALDWLLASPPTAGGLEKSPLIRFCQLGMLNTENSAATDAFIRLLAEHKELPHYSSAMGYFFRGWNRRDAAASLVWLDSVPDAALRTDLIRETIERSNIPADTALALAKRLPDAPLRAQKLAEFVDRWTTRDPDAALAWLQSHDEPELLLATQRVEGILVAGVASTDPAAATARWHSLPAGPEKTIAATRLAETWAEKDPAAAVHWLGALPEANTAVHSDEVLKSFRQIQMRWAHSDPLALLAWSKSETSPPPARELAIYALEEVNYSYFSFGWGANDLGLTPPPRTERATTLARIEDPSLRDQMLSSYLIGWLRSDPQTARAWIADHDALSAEAVARLFAEIH